MRRVIGRAALWRSTASPLLSLASASLSAFVMAACSSSVSSSAGASSSPSSSPSSSTEALHERPRQRQRQRPTTAPSDRFTHRGRGRDEREVHSNPTHVPSSATRYTPTRSPPAVQHLLHVHASMRSNYESLRQSDQVLRGFSLACADALHQLGITYRTNPHPPKQSKQTRGQEEPRSHMGQVRVAVSGGGPSAAFTLSAKASFLYAAPIAFPAAPLTALLRGPRALRPATHVDSGDMLLAEMMPATDIGAEGEADSSAVWAPFTRDAPDMWAAMRDVENGSAVSLLETLAYFKWAKDESALNWKQPGEAARICAELAALFPKETSPTVTDASGMESESHAALEEGVERFLRQLPRVDQIDTQNEPFVDVIDVMLNMLLRLCICRWPTLSFHEQMSLFLVSSLPWFTRDLSVEAAIWAVYCHLRSFCLESIVTDHQCVFLFVQRMRRLCWMTVHDTDTATVRRIFMRDGESSPLSSSSHSLQDVNSEEPNANASKRSEASPHADALHVPLFRDVVYVLYGSRAKQRIAYELLLLWMSQVRIFIDDRSHLRSRYISAIGVTLADIDSFITARHHQSHIAGDWLLLHTDSMKQEKESHSDERSHAFLVKFITRNCQTPHELTRLFFRNYRAALPKVWTQIGPRRRELIWTAWLRAIVLPLRLGIGNATNVLKCTRAALRADKTTTLLLATVTTDALKNFLERESRGGKNDENNNRHATLVKQCEQLVESAYSAALVLSSDDSQADELCSAFSFALHMLLRRATTADRGLVLQVLESILETSPGELRPFLGRICDGSARTAAAKWLRRAESFATAGGDSNGGAINTRAAVAAAAVHVGAEMTEPTLRDWQSAVVAAEAQLFAPVLPSITECCLALEEIIARRSKPHDAATANAHSMHEKESPGSNKDGHVLEVESDNSTLNGVIDSPPKGSLSFLTVAELCTALTALARAVLSRPPPFFNAALLALPETAPLESTTAFATQIFTQAATLPPTALLEGVMLRLVPFDVLLVPWRANRGTERVAWSLQLEDAMRHSRHFRLVGHVVLARHYALINPMDKVWSRDMSVGAKVSELDVERRDMARVLSDSLTRVEMTISESKGKHESKEREEEQENVDEVKPLELILGCHALAAHARLRLLESEDETEANVPVSSVMPTLREVLSRFLDRAESFCSEMLSQNVNNNNNNHQRNHYHQQHGGGGGGGSSTSISLSASANSTTTAATTAYTGHVLEGDAMLLWLCATATAAGLRLRVPRRIRLPLDVSMPLANVSALVAEETNQNGVKRIETEMQNEAEDVLVERTLRLVLSLLQQIQPDLLRSSAKPRLKFITTTLIALRALEGIGIHIDTAAFGLEERLQRVGSDRRLLQRHLNVFLAACVATASTRTSALLAAAHLRESRDTLAPAEMERAFVALAMAATAFTQSSQQQQPSQPPSPSHHGCEMGRAVPTLLRHAWSAMSRRALSDAAEMPTAVFVRAVECAAAVCCVDTLVCRQLLAVLVELRGAGLSDSDWAAVLRAARQSGDGRWGGGGMLQAALTERLQRAANGTHEKGRKGRKRGEERVRGMCVLVEVLSEVFIADAEFWELVRRALRGEWESCAALAACEEERQEWLRQLSQSYEWAVRCAGHHEMSELPIA